MAFVFMQKYFSTERTFFICVNRLTVIKLLVCYTNYLIIYTKGKKKLHFSISFRRQIKWTVFLCIPWMHMYLINFEEKMLYYSRIFFFLLMLFLCLPFKPKAWFGDFNFKVLITWWSWTYSNFVFFKVFFLKKISLRNFIFEKLGQLL